MPLPACTQAGDLHVADASSPSFMGLKVESGAAWAMLHHQSLTNHATQALLMPVGSALTARFNALILHNALQDQFNQVEHSFKTAQGIQPSSDQAVVTQ